MSVSEGMLCLWRAGNWELAKVDAEVGEVRVPGEVPSSYRGNESPPPADVT